VRDAHLVPSGIVEHSLRPSDLQGAAHAVAVGDIPQQQARTSQGQPPRGGGLGSPREDKHRHPARQGRLGQAAANEPGPSSDQRPMAGDAAHPSPPSLTACWPVAIGV
jgi:hypothetical protein